MPLVYSVSKEAIEKARAGEGPTLIECKTYRWYGHSEIDPANYRPPEEVEYWKARDPILRYEKFLMEEGTLSEKDKEEMVTEIEQELEEGIEFAEKSPYSKPESALEDVYSFSPKF